MKNLKNKKYEFKKLLNIRMNPIYNSFWITKFINKLTKDGKKTIAEKAIYKAFRNLQYKLKINAAHVILKSLALLKPIIGYDKMYRFGGKQRRKKLILIPVPIKEQKQMSFAIDWLIKLILNQKKLRHRHKYQNTIQKIKKSRGLSKSKKKTFSDRFQIASKNEQLDKIILNKLIEWHITNYQEIKRRKIAMYIKLTNYRTYWYYRWR